jgi:hypothetical protein
MNAGVMSKARYTLEFKQEAVSLVKAGLSSAVATKTLGIPSPVPI